MGNPINATSCTIHMESIIIIMDMRSIQLVGSCIYLENLKVALTVRKCSNLIYNTKLNMITIICIDRGLSKDSNFHLSFTQPVWMYSF